jgi:hypothetical protein
MSDKIVISFDDEKPGKSEEKIIIDFKPVEKINHSEVIQNSLVNSFYKGNSHLTGYNAGEFKYPEGIESGFRKLYSLKLNDTFLNSILLNNKFIILSSANGNVYFIDRFKGELFSKCILKEDAFEKTGLVIENKIYLNSVKSLYRFDELENSFKENKLYESKDNFYIWSNLNKAGNSVIFLEYSPELKSAYLAGYSLFPNESEEQKKISRGKEFQVLHYLSDSVITQGDFVFIFCDNKIIKFYFKDLSFKEYELKFNICPDTNFLYLDGKIYFNNKNNELFYFDVLNEDMKFTGIKCGYINSLSAFSDNLFIGTLDGWYLYKTSGFLLFSYEDIAENKIESLNKYILVVSKENKIIFHNLNKFQEAEGFSVSSGNSGSDSDKIVSVRIGDEAVFVLSKNGIIEAFNNDKLNLLLD